MRSHDHARQALLRSKYFRHQPLFYQQEPPDLFPLFSHDRMRTDVAQTWVNAVREHRADQHPPTALLECEYADGLVGLQRTLEQQRLQVLLGENPGFSLQYAEHLAHQLGINQGLVKEIAEARYSDRYLNGVIVSETFFYRWLGRHPRAFFSGSLEWWRLLEMIRAYDLEIPSDFENPIPKTGVLSGEAFWEAVANMVHGRIFVPFDIVNEEGSAPEAAGGGGAGSGGNGSGGSGSSSGGGAPAATAAPAPAPAPSGPTIGPDGSIEGDTNPPVEPETEEEGGWWSSLTNAVSNMSLSDIVHTTLDVVGLIPGLGEVADGLNALIYLAEGNYADAALSAAAMIPGAGAAATVAKYAKKSGLGKAMVKGGKKLVSKVDNAASKIKNGRSSAKVKETCVGGCPISMVTGEELLQFVDFELPGRLPFTFERTYRTGHSDDVGLGCGWTFTGCESLTLEDDLMVYHTDEARAVSFPNPTVGETVGQAHEQLTMARLTEDRIELENEAGLVRIFSRSHQRWLLTGYRDKHGGLVHFRYEQGRLRTVESGCGRALVLTWADGLIQSLAFRPQADAEVMEPVMSFEYSEARDLIANRDALGLGESYRFRNHILVQRTLRTGFNYYFEWDRYDSDARCLHNWGDGGIYDVRFTWFPEQHRSQITDSLGHTTTYQYNELGQLLRETNPEGHTTHYRRNQRGQITQMTQPGGATQQRKYDSFGRITQETKPDGAVVRFAYNELGEQTRLIDERGFSWRRIYDDQRQLVATVDPLGHEATVSYQLPGLPARIKRADGSELHFVWNERGELLREVQPDGGEVHFEYDARGRVCRRTEGNAATSYAYDAVGRLIQVTDPAGQVTHYGYHSNDMVNRIVDARGRETLYHYADGLNQVSQRVNPDGSTVTYHYDSERKLIALENEKGESHRFAYDGNERLVHEIGFDGREQRYVYDVDGLLVAHHDGPWHIRYERDAAGRLIRKVSRHSESGRQEICRFDYDESGRLIKADNEHRTLRFFFDPLGRLLEEWQDNAVFSHAWDAMGNRIQTQLPTGQNLQYAYNASGLRTGAWLDERLLTERSFDARGRERGRRWGNQLLERRGYDPAGRLREIHIANQNGAGDFARRNFQYDAAGGLTVIDDLRLGVKRFSYDPVSRLKRVTGVKDEVFAFDSAGNPGVAGTDTADTAPGNRLDTDAFAMAYDTCGNLVQCGDLTLSYGPNRHLEQVERDGLTTHYAYDALSRRVWKDLGGRRTEFLWDQDAMVAEAEVIPGSDREWKVFVYEQDQTTPLAMAQAGKHYFFHNDHLGTPLEMSDEQGRPVWAARYRAYGAVDTYLENAIENPLRFPGQYFDAETGLHYNRFRYYHPELGRFVQQDPVGLLGGLNPYEYAPNPINWIDPYGLTCHERLRSAKTIKFSQDTIRETFSDGRKVSETEHMLRMNPEKALDMEPILVAKMKDLPPDIQDRLIAQGGNAHDVFAVTGNRRLAAARRAKTDINTKLATPEDLAEINLDARFSTKTAGRGMPRVS